VPSSGCSGCAFRGFSQFLEAEHDRFLSSSHDIRRYITSTTYTTLLSNVRTNHYSEADIQLSVTVQRTSRR
jgi:hypothetical protein